MSEKKDAAPKPVKTTKQKNSVLEKNNQDKDVISSIAGGLKSAAQNYESSKKLEHAKTLNDLNDQAVRHLDITKRGLILQEELDNFEDLRETAKENVNTNRTSPGPKSNETR